MRERELRMGYRKLLLERHWTRGVVLWSRSAAGVRGSFPDFLHGDAYLRYFEIGTDRSLPVYVRKLYRITFDEEIVLLDVECVRFECGAAVDLAFKTDWRQNKLAHHRDQVVKLAPATF